MEKLKPFFKWFNRPAQILEAIGYIAVFIGLVCMAFGILGLIACIVTNPQILVMGAVMTFIAPQLFFAIAKVVKAAEKYLGER